MASKPTFIDATTALLPNASAEDRTAMLRTLIEYRSVLEHNRAEADVKVYLQQLKEESANRRKFSDNATKAHDRLAVGKVQLSIADKQTLAAAIRGSGSGRSGKKMPRGDALFRGWLRKEGQTASQNADDPGSYNNPADARRTILENLRGSGGVAIDDPLRPWLTQHVLDLRLWKPEELETLLGEEMWKAYTDGITQEARDDSANSALIARIETNSLDKPDLDKIKDATLKAAEISDSDVVMTASKPSKLEESLEAMMKSIVDGEDISAPKEGRWYGLTDEVLGDMVTRPGLRRWAKDHGLTDLGSFEGDSFVPGKDTNRMLLEIIRQRKMKNAVHRIGGDFEEEAEVVGGQSGPQMFVSSGTTGTGTDAKLTTVWAVNPNGSVEYLDLASGTVTPAKDAAGRWLSKSLEDRYGADIKRGADEEAGETEAAPHPLGFRGRAPLGKGSIMAGGPIDLNDHSFTPFAAHLLMPLPPRVVISGKRRLPTYGEDPNVLIHVKQPDGSFVTLRRANEDAPWQVNSDESSLTFAGVVRQKPDIKPEDLPEADDVPERGRRSGQVVYDDTDPRPAITDSPALKADEADYFAKSGSPLSAEDRTAIIEKMHKPKADADEPPVRITPRAAPSATPSAWDAIEANLPVATRVKKALAEASFVKGEKELALNSDGSIGIYRTGPNNDKIMVATVKAGTPEHAAEVAEIFGADPKFGAARSLAERGDWAGARAEVGKSGSAPKPKQDDAAYELESEGRAAVQAARAARGAPAQDESVPAAGAPELTAKDRSAILRRIRERDAADAKAATEAGKARDAAMSDTAEAERKSAVGGPVAARSAGMATIPIRGGYHPTEATTEDSKRAAADARMMAEHEMEMNEHGLASVDAAKAARLRAERESVSDAERSGIVARRGVVDLSAELEGEGNARVAAAQAARDSMAAERASKAAEDDARMVDLGAELEAEAQKQLLPKSKEDIRMEALRRARSGSVGSM